MAVEQKLRKLSIIFSFPFPVIFNKDDDSLILAFYKTLYYIIIIMTFHAGYFIASSAIKNEFSGCTMKCSEDDGESSNI